MSRAHLVAAFALMIAACGPREPTLPGERLDLRTSTSPPPVDRALPIALPAPRTNAAWTHKAGGPDHTITHPAFSSSLTRVFSTPIGRGDDRRHRITADPVIAGGLVHTLDSRATVAATTTGGAPVWSRDLTPPGERVGQASGGGLALGAGRLFVTTGYGELVALDPRTGAEYWRQDLDASAKAAPTVAGDTVYAVSRNAVGWAVDVATGRVRWQVDGTKSPTGFAGGAAPAVGGGLAIFPFASNEIVAVDAGTGDERWRAYVAGRRPGRAYAEIDDITGDPVLSGGRVVAGNHSGRAAAFDAETGTLLWSAREGALSPPWLTGGSAFIVSDAGELVRLDAETGARVWGTELPVFQNRRPARRKGFFAHYGPVLAGGRLIVASGDGQIRAFLPESGALAASAPIPRGAATNPVVAGGTLYVVSRAGRLEAYR